MLSLCLFPNPHIQTQHTALLTRTIFNPAVSHEADGLWSRLLRQRKSLLHTSQDYRGSYTPLNVHVLELHTGIKIRDFSSSRETHLANFRLRQSHGWLKNMLASTQTHNCVLEHCIEGTEGPNNDLAVYKTLLN